MQELFAKYGSTGVIVVVWIAIFYFYDTKKYQYILYSLISTKKPELAKS